MVHAPKLYCLDEIVVTVVAHMRMKVKISNSQKKLVILFTKTISCHIYTTCLCPILSPSEEVSSPNRRCLVL